MPSLQEYALVDQYRVSVEHYAKTGPRRWELREYDAVSEAIELVSLKLEVSLAEIYD
jgi:Uma2 family endonuclease